MLDQLILESLQKDQRLRPGASEVMYRLALAHDSNIATALSSVTVAPRRLAASTNVVGREDELAAISHEFERAHKGKARILVVSGEAGVGKTTLVDAFVSELEERGEPRLRWTWPMLGTAGRNRGLPAGYRGAREPAAERAPR